MLYCQLVTALHVATFKNKTRVFQHFRTFKTSTAFEIPFPRNSGDNIFTVRQQSTRCNVEITHFDSVPIQNERLLNYKSGSRERTEVKAALAALLTQVEVVPIVINGNEMRDNCHLMQNLPYNRSHCVAR